MVPCTGMAAMYNETGQRRLNNILGWGGVAEPMMGGVVLCRLLLLQVARTVVGGQRRNGRIGQAGSQNNPEG